jgi:ArsR family transcriptional regulator
MKKKNCPQCFSLIQVPARINIIRRLRRGPKMVNEILAHLPLTQPTVSYHLRVLEKSGMLVSRKRGRNVFYFLNKKYPCKKCPIFQIPLRYA